jgi:fructose/tagatose bisphosphate aldolase
MPIATPEIYSEMLDRAKKGAFAYPAINVSSSQTLIAALRVGDVRAAIAAQASHRAHSVEAVSNALSS